MGRGSSEGCLKWGGGDGELLRDLSKNILKQGVSKGKNCSWGGGGFEGVTTPASLSRENFNHTQFRCLLSRENLNSTFSAS